MSIKQQLAAAIDTLTESATLEEAIERIYRAFKMKQERQGRAGSSLSVAETTAEQRFLERAEQQDVLARQFPGEFVVLVDQDVIFHATDRSTALDAYQRARSRPDGRYPVFIAPDALLPTIPIVRGRSMARL